MRTPESGNPPFLKDVAPLPKGIAKGQLLPPTSLPKDTREKWLKAYQGSKLIKAQGLSRLKAYQGSRLVRAYQGFSAIQGLDNLNARGNTYNMLFPGLQRG